MQKLDSQQIYTMLKKVKIGEHTPRYSEEECARYAELAVKINRLKQKKNAVILVHSYVPAEIVYTVADHTGDSYGLSKIARASKADTIVFVAVRFMGETAKLLNPDKEVLITGEDPGCSLADSITGEDVRKLKETHPDYTFVCYINTTAEVKAECDVCVTSSNVNDIVEKIPNHRIFFLPDRLMGLNIREEMENRGVEKDIRLWDGTCYVHEEYSPDTILKLREYFPGIKVLSHPECSPGVLHHSDFVGSTSQLMEYMKQAEKGDQTYLMLTECGITSRLQVEMPGVNIVGTCSLCKYMKSNTLESILRVFEAPEEKDCIEIPPDVAERAVKCVNEMFRYTEN